MSDKLSRRELIRAGAAAGLTAGLTAALPERRVRGGAAGGAGQWGPARGDRVGQRQQLQERRRHDLRREGVPHDHAGRPTCSTR